MRYIWNIMRPAHEGTARAMLQAAYKPAIQTDPTATITCIRSYVHPNTISRGRFIEDNHHLCEEPAYGCNGTASEQPRIYAAYSIVRGYQCHLAGILLATMVFGRPLRITRQVNL